MYWGGVGGWHRFRTHIFITASLTRYMWHIFLFFWCIWPGKDPRNQSLQILIVQSHRAQFWSLKIMPGVANCSDQIDCTGKKPRCSCAPGWRLMTRPIVQNWFNQSLLCHRQIHKYPPRYTKTNKARDMGHDPYSCSKFNKTPHLIFVATITTAGCVIRN